MFTPSSGHACFASFSNPEIRTRIDADVLRIQSTFLEWIAEPTTGDSDTKVVETLTATLDAYARGYLAPAARKSLLPQYHQGLRRLGSAFIENAERQIVLKDPYSEDRLREMAENTGDFLSRKHSLTPEQQAAYIQEGLERLRIEVMPDAAKWNQWKGQLLFRLEARFEARYRYWAAEANSNVQDVRKPAGSGSVDESLHVFPSSGVAEHAMPVDASFWRTLRQDFERLEIHKFSLIWSSTAHADQFDKTLPESHWSWLDYPDESWKARLSAIVLRGARALGFESEDDWYDELRRSEFVGFATMASSREKQSDGTFVDSDLGAIHDVVKESITLCYKLEADASSAPARMAASDSKALQLTVAMSRPARNEIEKFANDTFATARDRLLKNYAKKEKRVLSKVAATRNRGAYLPALVKLRADRVRDTILALADAHVEAFTLCRTPSDAQAEKVLKTSAQQIAGGSISAVRGQLRLRSVRLRIPEEGQGLPWHLEIEGSMDAALKEGLLRLRRQRIQFRNSDNPSRRMVIRVGAKTAVPTLEGSTVKRAKAEKIERSTPQEVVKKKRGRPQTITDENKSKALQLKASGGTNKQAAVLIYGTRYPTPQQVKNVPAILRHHKLKSKQPSSPAKRSKSSPPRNNRG